MSYSEKLGPMVFLDLLDERLPDFFPDRFPDLLADFLRLFPPDRASAPRPLIFLVDLDFLLPLLLFLRLLPPKS